MKLRPLRPLPTYLALLLFPGIIHADVVIIGSQFINLDCSTGFEGGDLDGWYEDRVFAPAVTWGTSSSLPNSGAFSATVDGNNELRRDFAEFGNVINSSSVTGFQFDELTFSVRHPDSQASNLLVTAFYDDGSQAATNFSTISNDWEKFDATAFANSNSNGNILTGVSFFGNNSGSTFIDDITILASAELVPEPGCATLLCLGAAGLLRRRRN